MRERSDSSVLLVTQTWATAGYGGATSVGLLKRALEAAGWQVRVAARTVGEGAQDVYALERPVRDLFSVLRGDGFDVVHCYNMELLVPVSVAAMASGTPSVITANSYWATCLFADMLFPDGELCRGCSLAGVRRDFRTRDPATVGMRVPAPVGRAEVARRTFFLNRFSAVVALSESSREQLARGGARRDRMHVVPNIVDPSDLDGDVPALVGDASVLFVGQLKHVKGVRFLLEAFERLRERVPEASLTMVGEGPARASLEQEVATRGLEEAVSFLGYVPAGRVKELYREHRVLARPSLWVEPFSRVLLEAWGNGIPVVSTPEGAAGDVIDHEATGLLASSSDPGRFASALERVIGDDAVAEGLRRGGREEATRYVPAKVGSSYARVYEHVLSGEAMEPSVPMGQR